jgi:hypothetical protein
MDFGEYVMKMGGGWKWLMITSSGFSILSAVFCCKEISKSNNGRTIQNRERKVEGRDFRPTA